MARMMVLYCPKHGEIEGKTKKYCPECGNKLQKILVGVICPKCGKYYRYKAKYCTKCGTKLPKPAHRWDYPQPRASPPGL